MIPNREYINNSGSAFYSYRLDQPCFDFIWHHHPEYEITYVERGFGRRIVGDHDEDFSAGEITIFGPDLPHSYASQKSDPGILAFGVQFSAEIFPVNLLDKEEFCDVERLLSRCRLGIVFPGRHSSKLIQLLKKIGTSSGINRYSLLLTLLEQLGRKKNYRILASSGYSISESIEKKSRFDRACKHIHENYHRGISLEEMARVTNLSPTSFCRYFKKQTGKSFINYVNDWKIGRACQLLTKTVHPISQIALDCGFNNNVHFNRTFLTRKKINPRMYREQFTSD